MLFREFLARGYQAVPVNPDAGEIEGQPCFARLQEVQPPVEGVLFMTAPAVTDTLVRDCPGAGIKHVWMYRAGGAGAATADAIHFCESNARGGMQSGGRHPAQTARHRVSQFWRAQCMTERLARKKRGGGLRHPLD
jgi:hypothetical protein